MSLREDQSKFTRLVCRLIEHAYNIGYSVTFGDAYAKSGHIDDSFHYRRLAIDLNLFDLDGNYLTTTEDHRELGEYWKELDPNCTWGGDFLRSDGNHYSYGERR
jgi:hypothetical protein